jgi:hypothetical protein
MKTYVSHDFYFTSLYFVVVKVSRTFILYVGLDLPLLVPRNEPPAIY